MSTYAVQIRELQNALPQLAPKDVRFASNLINYFNRFQTLSSGQAPWVQKLIDSTKAPKTPQSVGDFSGVIALFNAARAHLKYPKIRLSINGTPVVLSVAGPKSRTPGAINLAGEGSFGNRDFYGRVTPDGSFDAHHTLTPAFRALLVPVLIELATDPITSIQRYGKLTGNCMFCGLTLTDPRSKTVGCGEICAGHWGLHDAWRNAASVAPLPLTAVLNGQDTCKLCGSSKPKGQSCICFDNHSQ